MALLRPWLIGTRSACATATTSKPPPHRIDSRLPATRVKRSQLPRAIQRCTNSLPETRADLHSSRKRRSMHPLPALGARTRGTEQRTVASSSTCRSGVCSVVDTRAQPNSCNALRVVPQMPDPARTRDVVPDASCATRAVTATCSEDAPIALAIGPARWTGSETRFRDGAAKRSVARLQGGPCRRLDSAPGPVQCARRRLARSAAGRSCPDLGLVGTPWDRDSPCATAAEEAAPCRDTSRNVVQRQTAAYGAEPNTHPEGSR